ncbi:RelA/SpoT family protein [Thermodesulfovibrio yellowstonii]|uniref:GTP pyrophosphokinase (ATP:GTP 3'-pyrophosphotransferase)(PpGpp synthetase I) ((P)ppGpp synthetase) n=1 Tax=Thermodesulfovibrio yellowstonii (strain ATCC 51303 / DSM 11347 / YP87) TaxID=289376 RepID=B5YKS3_THEYD|nr:bifunctional (p)ppGpp synthetase/guanosine-3',5'-bis(diphosphate) 3'-pyrophosphohydrolase [Thermodesulfovibrio yellowstonii]ACI21418.1 GTP pyrophosphokinase (ATP:GTP 3'-pyrophosphotransferase)(ppGpp synthetase I) ((P)ppGpp synthetase) [Thermodesulfovibrio yellowstonii DSM 11347]
MLTIENVIEKVLQYRPNANVELIKKAYIFSREAHCAQKRKEGIPYIYHPLAVAAILADMKLDSTTIAAGLLHDTVEDAEMTIDDIGEIFTPDVAFLVDAVTKLSKLQFSTVEEAQAESFRKMFLAMSKDIRVILIKFADRLHNMRTIEFLPPDKQKRIAKETLEIYAPLANRLGIGWMRSEFEDLSFKVLYPDEYDDLVKKVAKRKEDQQAYIDNVINILSEKISAMNIPFKIYGRVKHYYGIYQKLIKQKIPFEQVYDVIGIRIITDTVPHCYDILGIIHSLWTLIPGRFKDFISLPKSNYYQSLHTTVIGPGGERVEFQIRTEEMDIIAEEGIAAHWRYKERKDLTEREAKIVSRLRDLIKEISDPKELLDAVKAEVVPDTIYIFTPKGDVKELPVNSTPVDFAYAIHSEVGARCAGAKVNGRIVPLNYQLQSGDVVEIITSPHQKPRKDWLQFVVTQRARNRIKHFLRQEERQQGIDIGKQLLEAELRKQGIQSSILKTEKMEEILQAFSVQSIEDLYLLIGHGKISVHQVVNRLSPEIPQDEIVVPKKVIPRKEHKQFISLKGVDEVLYHIAKCCMPVPGDEIIGFITRGKGISVHRKDCLNIQHLEHDRLIEVFWTADDNSKVQTKISIECIDAPGILATITALLSANQVNITAVKANSTSDKRALIDFTIEVKDRTHLSDIINKISQIGEVISVKR